MSSEKVAEAPGSLAFGDRRYRRLVPVRASSEAGGAEISTALRGLKLKRRGKAGCRIPLIFKGAGVDVSVSVSLPGGFLSRADQIEALQTVAHEKVWDNAKSKTAPTPTSATYKE
jgi:hypothetical protein